MFLKYVSGKYEGAHVLDKVLKILGIVWSVIAFVAAVAFFAGGEWQAWQRVRDRVLEHPDVDVSSQVKSIEERINSLESALITASHQPYPTSAGNVQTSLCPPGAYMVAARFQIDSGGPHGIVSNIFPICKAILPNQPP